MEVAHMLLRSKSEKAQEQACAMADQILAFMQDPSDSGVSKAEGKEAYKAEMRALRKRVGNASLLSPRLLTSSNLVNARIMLLVAKLAWTAILVEPDENNTTAGQRSNSQARPRSQRSVVEKNVEGCFVPLN
jgi:hypothetical protein